MVESVDRPVNVLALPGVPPVAELGAIGVGRISVGSGFTLVAYGALVEASRELLDQRHLRLVGHRRPHRRPR